MSNMELEVKVKNINEEELRKNFKLFGIFQL